MAQIRINSLTFSDGNSVDLADLTVIVGPNNSGKTRLLLDIDALAREQKAVVLRGIDLTPPSILDDLFAQTSAVGAEDTTNNSFHVRAISASLREGFNTQFGGGRIQVEAFMRDPAQVRRHFGSLMLARLGTEERLTIAKASPPTSNTVPPTNLLQVLYRDPDALERVNCVFRGIFGTSLRLDYSELVLLKLRVGTDIDRVPVDPQRALYEFPKYPLLDDQGDGMRSAAAVLLALEAVHRPITLIDEPEAFLHPPQARALGRHLGCNPGSRQIIIATHSTDLLRGVLAGGKDLRVIRLARRGNQNVPHVIDPDVIRALTQDPLLSSARVLEGIFYRGAIVTEADADRAFYERVAAEVLLDNDFHYTHAQNKQTISRVVDAYRKLGVPCASIVDIDLLNDAVELRKLLIAHGADAAECAAALSLRETVEAAVCAEPAAERLAGMIDTLRHGIALAEDAVQDAADRATALARVCDRVKNQKSPWQPVKQGGVDALPSGVQSVFADLAARCAQHGLFLVPVGELEGWLRGRVPLSESNKHDWIVHALQVLPNLQVRLEERPWSFIADVHHYLETAPLAQERESVPAEASASGTP